MHGPKADSNNKGSENIVLVFGGSVFIPIGTSKSATFHFAGSALEWARSIERKAKIEMLRANLCADLKRQYELEERTIEPNILRLATRLLHPRFLPLVICRLSRAAFESGIPLFPQLLTYMNVVLFGLEITPRCEIGPGLFLPHTSGTVIGASRIGKNATIYQNVTVGSKILDMGFDPAKRPEIGDCVTLGAGCKVLGGIQIGNDTVIGANSVVLNTVKMKSVVVGVPARILGPRD